MLKDLMRDLNLNSYEELIKFIDDEKNQELQIVKELKELINYLDSTYEVKYGK